MSALLGWPSFAGLARLPDRIDASWGIWGKVHGLRSDFRWIGRSPGLPRDDGLVTAILTGAEDAPAATQLFRCAPDMCIAIGCYPGRARDASGRSGLEKQILVARATKGLPEIVALMAMLPHVASLDDGAWWNSRPRRIDDPAWADPDVALPLNDVLLPLSWSALERDALAGIQELLGAVPEGALVRFYASLLAGQRPAILSGLSAPLSPQALVALHLPLRKHEVRRASILGWPLSANRVARSLHGDWGALVCDRWLDDEPPAPEARFLERAGAVVDILRSSGAYHVPLSLSARRLEQRAASSPEARVLLSFAASTRPWIEPSAVQQQIGRRLRPVTEADAACLREAADRTEALSLRSTSPITLEAKAELLRAAALALAPSSSSDLVENAKWEHVAPLAFAPELEEDAHLAGMAGAFQVALTRSLTSPCGRHADAIRKWCAHLTHPGLVAEAKSVLAAAGGGQRP